MAITARATIILNANNLVPNNITEDVSPQDVRERLVNLADSAWNRSDEAQATAPELAALTETAVRMYSPAQLLAASHTSQDADGDTRVELERAADNDTIYLVAQGTDMVEINSTLVLLGNASTKVQVQPGTNLITLDGEVILPDFTNARADGSTTKAFYADGSGNLQYGTITASGGVAIQDADTDTTLSVEKTADNDTLTLTIGANEYLSASATIYKLGDIGAVGQGTVLELDDTLTTGETAVLKANNGVTLQSGTGKTLLLDGPNNKLALATLLDLQLINYPNTRDDGATSKALYVDASGNVLYGSVSGGGGTTIIQDADSDTYVRTEATPDVDQVEIYAGGTRRAFFDANNSTLYDTAGTSYVTIGNGTGRFGRVGNGMYWHGGTREMYWELNTWKALWYSQSTGILRVRIGDIDANVNGTYVDVDDQNSRADILPAGTLRARFGSTQQYIGGTAGTYLLADQTANTITLVANTATTLLVEANKVTAGTLAATGLLVDNAAVSEEIYATNQGVKMLQIVEAGLTGRLYLGDQAEVSPTYLDVDANGNIVDAYAAGTKVLALTSTTGTLGAANNTFATAANNLVATANSRAVLQLTDTAVKLGDYNSAGNGVRVEADDTAQTIKLHIGATARLQADTAGVDVTGTLDVTGNINGAKLNSESGTKIMQVLITDDFDAAMVVGDGAYYVEVPAAFNGMDIVAIRGRLITAGTTGTATVQVHNVTAAADILSTVMSFASGATAGTGAVIDGTQDDLTTGDLLRFDIDAIHTGTAAEGCIITLECKVP